MNVLIIPNSGPSVGFGHIRRCRAIADALIQRRHKVTLSEGLPPKLPSRQDLVIIDHPGIKAPFLERFRSRSGKLVAIDDNGDIHYDWDWIINGNIFAPSIPYSVGPRTSLLLGLRFHPLAKEYRAAPPKRIRPKVRSVLVTLGGAPQNSLLPVLHTLIRAFPESSVDVISPERPSEKPPAFSQVRFRSLVPSLYPFIQKADLVISGGGQTSYQLASTGTPGVGIELSMDQGRNLAAMAFVGSIFSAGRADSISFERTLSSALRRIASPSVRREMSEAGRSLIDGAGVSRVVKVLESA